MQLALRFAASSDVGLGPKSRNEDSGYAGPHLLVLADGMGGHAAGDVASSMVVSYLAPLDEEALNAEQALRRLGEALTSANSSLGEAMSENPALDGMGTTTIAMVQADNKLAMAHIGDSRAYLMRQGELTQITKDHSFVQQLVDSGRITREEAGRHPQRSLVTRVMTGSPEDEPDLSIRELLPGDRYLLCSDGLSDYVSVDVIEEILATEATPEAAARKCVEVALKASTRDNVTVIVADAVDLDSTEPAPSTVPQVVGAAGARRRRPRTRAIPVSPAEKAALLAREARGVVEEPSELLAVDDGPSRLSRWLRRLGAAALLVAVLAGAGYGAYAWSQRQLYVGAWHGYVAIYRGFSQNLGPIALNSVDETTDIALNDLPAYYQTLVTDTFTVKDSADAEQRLAALRAVAAACQVRPDPSQPCTLSPDSSATPTTQPTSPVTGLPAAPSSGTASASGTATSSTPGGGQ